MHVCMHVCIYVCMYVSMYVCMFVCLFVCMLVCLHAHMYVFRYVCVYVCLYACMHACMHVCMYVCMYVCMCGSAFTAPASGITTKMDVVAPLAVKGLNALSITHRRLGQRTWIGGCHSVTHYDSVGTLGSFACSPGLIEVPLHPVRGEPKNQDCFLFLFFVYISSLCSNKDKDTKLMNVFSSFQILFSFRQLQEWQLVDAIPKALQFRVYGRWQRRRALMSRSSDASPSMMRQYILTSFSQQQYDMLADYLNDALMWCEEKITQAFANQF